jgi:hypothetical protein
MELEHARDEPRIGTSHVACPHIDRLVHRIAEPRPIGEPAERRPEQRIQVGRGELDRLMQRTTGAHGRGDQRDCLGEAFLCGDLPAALAASGDHRGCHERDGGRRERTDDPGDTGTDEPCRDDTHRHEDLPRHPERRWGRPAIGHEPAQ